MHTVTVSASRPYAVHIGGGLLDRAGELLAGATKSRRCAVVTDSAVGPLYGDRVLAALERAGFAPLLFTFPAGERSKNLSTYGQILDFFAKNRLTRSDLAVALGGGVTGDMAGFAAATYQRGVDYVQIPTTFLAASDSSVGGKTAVDLAEGKNLVGAFWQPRLVICDTDTFRTLPGEVFDDGAAETVKHGLIADRDFLRLLMTGDLRERIDDVVRRNVEIKAAVVAEDEFEGGRRKILNFGHTLGHAIEQLSGFAITHGHAVARGRWPGRWRGWACPRTAPTERTSSTAPPQRIRSAAAAPSTWWFWRRSAGPGPSGWTWRACGPSWRRPYGHYHHPK